MKRSIVLSHIRVAAYHGDHYTAARLYCENRISRKAFNEAMQAGQKMKTNGIKCSCKECQNVQ